MIEEPINETTQAAALENVEAVVTRIWEHPLVTEDLRVFRQESEMAAREIAARAGIDYDQTVFIPVSSTVWGIDNESDHDFVVVTRTQEEKQKVKEWLQEYRTTEGAELLKTGRHREILDVVLCASFDQDWQYPHVLVTPDEYILGSQELAAECRLNIVQTLSKFIIMDPQESFDSNITRVFRRAYKGWKEADTDILNVIALTAQGKPPETKRTDRFNHLLDQRAFQSHVPEKWKEAFLQALDNFELPSLATYKMALESSNGQLHLRSNYSAQGIQS